jgi:lipopolysaccharide transport system ATP-binding protein
VASLLEVGTGFHPELTGRENIFLNGAILGMTRSEIVRKFDEIVAFAEVERFIDTPVKRYSSGMYVRLAFAVAAHLEPEILIVDEVLAVGDREFQNKCMGKMGEVARDGRTVLFVSHNMGAIKSLTTRGILLDKGRIAFAGSNDQLIQHYSTLTSQSASELVWGKGVHTKICSVRFLNQAGESVTQYIPGEPFRLEVIVDTDGTRGLSLEVFLTDATRTRLGMMSSYQLHGQSLPEAEGRYRVQLALAPLWLASGNYAFDVATSAVDAGWDHTVETAISFDVMFSNPLGYPWDFQQSYGFGSLALLCCELPLRFQAE